MSNAAAALLSFLFRVLGTTNDVTTCEHCGRTELRGTIILGVLDEDGNVVERVHYGATCGARAAGMTVKDFRKGATAADRARKEAEQAERLAAMVERGRLADLARGTAECPTAPTICRKTRKGDCIAHP